MVPLFTTLLIVCFLKLPLINSWFFLRWIKTIRNIFEREHIAVNGKTRRHSLEIDIQASMHMVSTWPTENNLVLA